MCYTFGSMRRCHYLWIVEVHRNYPNRIIVCTFRSMWHRSHIRICRWIINTLGIYLFPNGMHGTSIYSYIMASGQYIVIDTILIPRYLPKNVCVAHSNIEPSVRCEAHSAILLLYAVRLSPPISNQFNFIYLCTYRTYRALFVCDVRTQWFPIGKIRPSPHRLTPHENGVLGGHKNKTHTHRRREGDTQRERERVHKLWNSHAHTSNLISPRTQPQMCTSSWSIQQNKQKHAEIYVRNIKQTCSICEASERFGNVKADIAPA